MISLCPKASEISVLLQIIFQCLHVDFLVIFAHVLVEADENEVRSRFVCLYALNLVDFGNEIVLELDDCVRKVRVILSVAESCDTNFAPDV